MSETMHFVYMAKNQTPEQIDKHLTALVASGIDCYAEGSSVFVNPDQWEKASKVLRSL